MPLTDFQHGVLETLASMPNDARYLAGGAALHFTPQSLRYSDDLDFFHDSEARVATAFAADRALLTGAGYTVTIELSQPGMIRAMVERAGGATRVDWAHDSAWRFMPLVHDPLGGWVMHGVDLATNKLLALAGRDEPRDFVDILYVHREVLPVAAVAWAAVGKDPGFSPHSLLDLLRRRGRPRPEEVARLQLAAPFDLAGAKAEWTQALDEAERFAGARPPEEVGCLYFSSASGRFVVPELGRTLSEQGLVTHYGTAGGVVPRIRS